MLFGLFAMCIIMIRFCPEAAASRFLQQTLVEPLLSWLAKTKRHHIILVFVMVGVLLAAGQLIGVLATTDILPVALDLSLYLDAVIATSAIAVVARVATSSKVLRSYLLSCRERIGAWFGRAAREIVTRRAKAQKSQDKDEDPAGAYGFVGHYSIAA
jgi:hypothetical protein